MNKTAQGLIFILSATFLWAFNGNIGSWLFATRNFTPTFLVVMRLIGSGFFLFIYNYLKYGHKSIHILKIKSNYRHLIPYAFGGVLLLQFGYFMAIFYSNAPTATLIQDIGIFFVIGFLSYQHRQLPSKIVFFALFVSMIGVFLLVTGGDMNNLQINNSALLGNSFSHWISHL